MTFDEAIEKIEELQGSAGYATGGVPEANNFSGYDVHEYLNAATEIINELREEYAPTVEMNKKQYHSFELWKYHTAGWNMTNCAEWARDENITANNAMQAWLHPETIKVVDE